MNTNIFGALVLEQNPKYVNELEAKYNIQLPPIFKAFVQTFEFGKMNPSPQHKIKHPNKELGFGGIENNLQNKFIAYTESGEYYLEKQMFPIIQSGIYSGGFCLGLIGENIDKIYLYTEDWDNKFELVADNILQFISQLKEVHWDNI